MEQTPPLLSSVQFDEAKKGYDREQVDNFLRELSVKVTELKQLLTQATARAEAAEAEAAEAVRAKQTAEAVLDKARAEVASARQAAEEAAASASVASEAEKAAGVLALAEKTARQAITDARAQAEAMQKEAEEDLTRLRREGLAKVERDMAEKAKALQSELNALTTRRDDAAGEVALVEAELREHRAKVQATVLALQQAIGGASGTDAGAEEPTADAPVASDAGGDAASSTDEPSTDAEASLTNRAPADRKVGEPVDGSPEADVEPPAEESAPAEPPVEPPAEPFSAPVAEEPVAAPAAPPEEPRTIEPMAPADDDDGLPVVTVEDLEARRSVPGVEAGEAGGAEPRSLFAPDDGPAIDLTVDPGPATAPYDALADEPTPTRDVPQARSPLGEPDEQADAAMRAFFEGEVDDDKGGKGRFLRRR